MITGNKGEWSELYTLFYLLGLGKLYAADDNVHRMDNIYFPVLKIMRKKNTDNVDYELFEGNEIRIFINGKQTASFKKEEFKREAAYLYNAIKLGSNRSFEIEQTEDFMNKVYCDRLAAPSSDKTDITLQLHDINTGYDPIMGFSIKSELGNPPTLLNASGATNFIYEVTGITEEQARQINSIETRTKILDRIEAIYNYGGNIKYTKTANELFSMNLMLIDSMMEDIIAEMLLYSYRTGSVDCKELMKHLDQENPLGFPRDGFYTFKYKKLLSAIALGMKPSALWDGIDEANGGYIIVTSDGDVLAYHLYNRNAFEEYLLKNTKLERGSTDRHGYASIYEEADSNKMYIKLNLQIRFK